MRALSLFSAAVGLALMLVASPAMAECDVLAFEVNDYGKEGPTRDALALLDKHIVATMAKRWPGAALRPHGVRSTARAPCQARAARSSRRG